MQVAIAEHDKSSFPFSKKGRSCCGRVVRGWRQKNEARVAGVSCSRGLESYNIITNYQR